MSAATGAVPGVCAAHRLRSALQLLVLVALYAAGAFLSWGRWTDPLVDVGRQLYLPWRILAGEVLYRDLASVFGPLAPYLNALLMAPGGVSLAAYAHIGLAMVALHALLLRALFGLLAGAWGGTFAAALFLLLFAFPQYVFQANFNFVTPYSSDLCYGLWLAEACLYLLLRDWLRTPLGTAPRVLAGACAALVALTKPEVLAALAGALVCLALLQRREGRYALSSRAFWCGVLLVFATTGGLFALVLPLALVPGAVFRAVLAAVTTPMGTTPYYAWVSGLEQPLLNASRLCVQAYPYALALGVGVWLDRRARLSAGAALALKAGWLCAFPLVFVALFGSTWIVQHAVRPLPLLVLVALVLLLPHALRPGQPRAPLAGGWIVIGIFGLMLLAKIVLAARFFHYGFALAMPAALWLAALLAGGWNRVTAGPRALRPGWVQAGIGALMLGVALGHVQASREHYAQRTLGFGAGSDRMLIARPEIDARGPVLAAALEWLRARTPAAEHLLVLPDGAMLNVMLGRAAGVPWYALPQPELLAYGEPRVLDAYRAHPPHTLLVLDQSNRLFGRLGEKGYGEAIAGWIRAAYTPCMRFRSDTPTPGFYVDVLRRADLGCPQGGNDQAARAARASAPG